MSHRAPSVPATPAVPTNPTPPGQSTAAFTSLCPECEAPVPFARAPLAGQVVTCTGCGAELEVTSRDPLRLELAPEVEEDWGE